MNNQVSLEQGSPNFRTLEPLQENFQIFVSINLPFLKYNKSMNKDYSDFFRLFFLLFTLYIFNIQGAS